MNLILTFQNKPGTSIPESYTALFTHTVDLISYLSSFKLHFHPSVNTLPIFNFSSVN